MRILKLFAASYLGTAIFALVNSSLNSALLLAPHRNFWTLLVLVVIIGFWFLDRALWKTTLYLNPPEQRESGLAFALCAFWATTLILWSVPAFVLYVTANPNAKKRAVQISIFLLSSGVGIVYFLRNRNKFPTPADKVTYFTGICLGPATAVALLL